MFEGIDSSGKTTILNNLCGEPHIKTLSSPPSPYDQLKQQVLENACPMSRLVFFLASNIQISENVEKLLPYFNVISDRYVFSTIVYHMALERIPYSSIEKIVSESLPYMRMPEKVILFTVDREEQLKRYKNKKDDLLQKQLAKDDEFQKRLIDNYKSVLKSFESNWIEINTTNLTFEETKERVLSNFK